MMTACSVLLLVTTTKTTTTTTMVMAMLYSLGVAYDLSVDASPGQVGSDVSGSLH